MPDFLHGIDVVEITDGVRPITAPASSVIGLVGTAPFADAEAFPLDRPVRVTTSAQVAALTATMPAQTPDGDEGTLPWAVGDILDQARPPIVVVRVESNEDAAIELANVVGQAEEGTGCYALLAAQSDLGLKPKILIATGYTDEPGAGATANAAVVALKAVAAKLRAIVIPDGPSDTPQAVIDKAGLEAGDRVWPVEPAVKSMSRLGVITSRPASARAAGAVARSDAERGFWWSPSNIELYGVVGLDRPIEFSLTDTTAESNLLNEAGVTAVVNHQGFRLWGNRTGATDPQWQFLSVRRTADMIYEAIEASFVWAMDRPISAQLLDDILGSVQSYLRQLKAQGAIIGGRAWLDPELNNEAALKAGKLYVNFDIEPPAPLERLTFQARREGGYYAELVSSVADQTT